MPDPKGGEDKKVGSPATRNVRQWVQTDKAAHEAWARLCVKEPKASGLLHMLIAQMNHGRDPVVVISQKLLAKLMGCSLRTISRSIKKLEDDNWIESIKLGQGTVSAYRINSRAAWTAKREDLKWSRFNGLIVADAEDQTDLKDTSLRRIPTVLSGEMQLPSGDGEDPPSQPFIEGMEPDLPSVGNPDSDDEQSPEQLEQQQVLE